MSTVAAAHRVAMSAWLPSQPFVVNDVEYQPFGLGWLRGMTPARLAVVAIVCAVTTTELLQNLIGSRGMTAAVAIPWLRSWGRHFAAAIPLALMIVWVDRHTAQSPWKTRIAAFALATLLGSAAFAAIGVGIAVLFGAPLRVFTVNLVFVWFYIVALPAALLCAVLFCAAREREAGRALLRSQLARVAAERQASEARLQLLKAQIEPHFLFNSLASVKRLYEQEVGGGKHLLRNLNAYLRAAVGRGREDESTLADQVAMAHSYLDIFRQRMGERLRVSIDVPVELQLARIPTLMLGTLVENAIKHGIGPRGHGGTIAIRACREGQHLVLEVSDDGLGFRERSGSGVGLANTRARLSSLYSGDGDIELRTNPGGGVTAAIRMPLRLADHEVPIAGAVRTVNERGAGAAERQDTYTRRVARILTWKHWAWAIAIGVVVSAIEGLRTVAAIFDMLGMAWVHKTGFVVTAACLYMIAIVLVEATCAGTKAPSAWRYIAGFVAASLVFGWIWWTFPIEPTGRTPQGQKLAAELKKNPDRNRRTNLAGAGIPMIALGALGVLLYVWLRNSQRAAEALAKAEIERTEAEQKLIASRLEAVEAEVDPAFMFSTLETIESTYDRDRVAAEAMLDELIAFLRAAIPRLRSDATDQATARSA